MARHRRNGSGCLGLLICPAVFLAGCGRSDAPSGSNVPADLLDRACAHFAAGRYEQAAVHFQHVLSAQPDLLEARRQWAYSLAALGRFDDVDRALRMVPPEGQGRPAGKVASTEPGSPSADPQRALMLWRRAFNVYRYYYHVTSPHPSGVFRTAAIRDALEVLDLGDLAISEVRRTEPLPLAELLDLLRLWVHWDQVARDADLCPNRRLLPLLMVAEPERLQNRVDDLVALEQETAGRVWLHPDDQGNWLAHPGAILAEDPTVALPCRAGAAADELTETASPADDLATTWQALGRWLGRNVPVPAITIVAAVRPEMDRPFDRRLVLVGRLQGQRFVVERVGTTGPADALLDGFAEYRWLLRARQVTARSTIEVESLAAAYSAAGLPATAFSVDQRQQLFAEDRVALASLLSFVRYGAALFGQPVVMTAAPSE